MNILFICKFNRFRSQIAEAYFNKINKNKKIKAKSAGLIKCFSLDKTEIKTAKKLGIDIDKKSDGLSSKLLIWSDVVVIVANDVPVEIFERKEKGHRKIIVWKIKDADDDNPKEIEKIINEIKKKVEKLVKKYP